MPDTTSPKRLLARALSRVGHPVVLVPVAILARLWAIEAPASVTRFVAGVIVAICVIGMAYAAWQVRRGNWVDSDASIPSERRDLTTIILGLLLLAGLVALAMDQPRSTLIAIAVAALVIGSAKLLSPWMKVSLHTSFAALVALVWWPHLILVTMGIAFTAAIAWSRLELSRHTRAEVLAGAAIGASAGFALSFI